MGRGKFPPLRQCADVERHRGKTESRGHEGKGSTVSSSKQHRRKEGEVNRFLEMEMMNSCLW